MNRVESITAAYAPRIAAAAQRDAVNHAADNSRRDAALVEAPEMVCGIPLRALTLPDYLALIVAGNAHVTPAPVPEDPVAQIRFWAAHSYALVWLVSPSYRADPAARDAFVATHAARLNHEALLAGLRDYLRGTFADAPRASSETTPGAIPPPDPIGCSFALHWQHRIAAAYHWSREEIRRLPLKEMFQILRLIEAERKAKQGELLRAPLSGEADRLWAEMLRHINGAN